MKRITLLALAAATFAASTVVTSEAGATNYTLWVHGRNTGTKTQQGNYADWSYWGPATGATGVNPKAVNWDGVSSLSSTNAAAVRPAFDRFCTGANWCYLVGHSTGGPQIAYAMALYGASARPVTDPATGKATGATQTGWNIKWAGFDSSAEGGTELADLGYWAVSDAITSDLRTGTIRPAWNHGTTQGKTYYEFAGASGTLYSSILPGQDDEVLAYHSTLGVTTTASVCNWSDWFCDNYVRMNGSMQWYYGGNSTWAGHAGWWIDQSEAYNHYTNQAWGGITTAIKPWVGSNAL